MKTIILILFAICMGTKSNAQTNSSELKQEILNLLKSKHDYERIQTVCLKSPLPYKTMYKESFAKIKENKRKIISYIDNALKVDASVLSKEVIFYKYISPVSSDIDPNNRISLLNYYKIVKNSLESSSTMLPQSPDTTSK